MQETTETVLLQKAIAEIETSLGWGSSAFWTTPDFETLSAEILEKTSTALSVTTLKRLWGKVKYQSRPNPATLNALVQFIEYKSWRDFQKKNEQPHTPKVIPTVVEAVDTSPINQSASSPSANRHKTIRWSLAVLVIAAISTIAFYSVRTSTRVTTDPISDQFSFSSEKMERSGVPNSVIFKYDASKASASDTVMIQQSWDERLRETVNYENQIHHSIYYYPGCFIAKLLVNGQIMQEHDVVIETDGWLPIVEKDPVPMYFKPTDIIKGNGRMELTANQISAHNISFQPETPWVNYLYIKPFESINSADFTFETYVKNTYNIGTGVCQNTQIYLQLKGGVIIIPLAIKGCVSQLAFHDSDGPKPNPAGLGVDFSDWVKVKCKIEDKKGTLWINDQKIYDVNLDFGPTQIMGVKYRFQGGGSVRSVCLKNGGEEIVFEDYFEAPVS